MNNSIVWRLLTRLLVATGLALTATLALLVWQLEPSVTLVLDRGLGETMDEIVRLLETDEEGRPVDSFPEAFKAQFNQEYFFTVSDDLGNVVLSIPEGRTRVYHPFEHRGIDGPQYFEHHYLGTDENYLGITNPVIFDEKLYWIQLSEDVPKWENALNYSIDVFLHGAGIVLILHFLASAVITYVTVRAAFRPVERAARQARAITPAKCDIRIDCADLPGEVVPLAETINRALERLEKALAAQKRFTADAAHELLTPIAVLKADIEMIEDEAIAGSLSEEIEEMVDIVTQLLELSALESDEQLSFEVCDLRQIASDVLIKLAPLAIKRGIDPEMTGADEPVLVRGSPMALLGAINNLVKNAINHATGATRLEVSVQQGGRVSVIDDGPGVPEALRERIFERFHRAGDPNAGGRGLGLAIVRRVVEAHGGQVYVTDPPEGHGAAFVIDLTAADQVV